MTLASMTKIARDLMALEKYYSLIQAFYILGNSYLSDILLTILRIILLHHLLNIT